MKKSFKALALTFFVILSAALIAMGTSAASLPGDVNGDGEVNIRDAATILQYVTGYDVQLVAPCTHTGNVVIDPEVAPTYDQSGLTVGVHCTKCGEILIPQETVPPLGHTHTEAVLPAVAATCQQEGLTEGKYCSVCNAVLLKQQPTPKTDHELGDWEAYGSYTVRRCIKSEDCDVALRVKSVTATYNGERLLTGEQVWKSDISVTVTLSDNTSFTAKSKEFTLENDVMTVDGNNVVTVKFVNTSTTVTVPAIHGNLPGTNPASDFEYSGADKDAITITKYIGTSANVVIPAHIDRIPVRYIGDSAFSENKTVQSVTIPGSILSIGNNAFYNCIGLRTLNLNEGLTSIGERAFMYTAIKSLTIPNTVTIINSYYYQYANDPYQGAFENCKNLTEIKIGDGLTYIDSETFYGCTALKSVTIGESVATINSHAFAGCSALVDIDFGSGVQTINRYAFSGCKALREIELGSSIQAIGDYAFSDCSALKTIDFSVSTQTIGNFAFQNCTSLPSVNIPSNVHTIGEGAFVGCSALRTLILNEGLQTIKGRAFMGCPIVSLTIPDSVTTIVSYYYQYANDPYQGAFENCKNLTEIKIGDCLTYIDSETFYGCTALKSVTIGESVATINSHAFAGCSALVDIDFGSGVQTINRYAFSGCKALTELELGSAVQSIGDYAFSDCSALKTIDFSVSTQTIGNFAFQNCTSLPSVNIPSNVQTIGEGAFMGCNELTILTLNEGLQTIKGRAFMGCPIASLTIPDSVTTIVSYYYQYANDPYQGAFENCKNLTEIKIGDGLTYIDSETFYGCTALKSVTIGESVATINSHAFAGCSALVDIDFGSGVQTINRYAFSGCKALTELELGSAVQSIGDYAFSDCSALKTIDFSVSTQTIGSFAFQNCTSLPSVNIPSNVQTIGEGAFMGCNELTILTLNEGLQTIKGRAFMGCPIVSLTIPDSVTTIVSYYYQYANDPYQGAFENCKNLTNVVIGKGLTNIDRETFAGCSALENVVIGSSVHTISDYAFSNCTALVSINIPDNVTTIGANAFKGCTLLENFRLGTGVQSIGASALQDCTSIDTVTIPANVQVIGNNAFTGCVELDETVIEKGALQSIGSNAYSGCSDFDRIYYTGTESDWERITVNSTNVYPLTETPYYYSATAPAVSGNYWYYNSNGDKRVWKLNQVSFKAEEYSEDFAYAEFGSEETSYSNQYLKELKSDSWLQAGIAVWEGLNTVTDFDSKKITKKHVYKLVIYDLLMGEVGSNVNPLACMEEACDSYILEFAEYLLEDEITDLETLKYLNPAQYDQTGFIDKFFKGVDGAEFIFQTTSNLYDALYTCAQYQALSDMDENFYQVLIEISKDSSLPSDLRNAAKECANCYQTASTGMLAKVIAKEFAASTMEDLWLEYAEVAWEAVITSIFPQYKVVEMAVKGVMFLANAGFNLDARNEAYYQLEAAVGLENALRKVIKNTLPDYLRDDLTDKSEYYLYAIEMYQTSVLLGFDYSGSLLSEFSKGLDVNASERQEYAATISKLGQMKTSKKQTYNNFDQSIEQLFVEYYAY